MQRQFRGLIDPLHDEGSMRLQHPFAVPTHLARRYRASRPVTLQQLHSRRNRNAEPLGSRPAALTTQNRRHNPFAKIVRKRSRHQMLASIPASILNHKSDKSGIPFDSVKS
jgi:hypothetical protein